MAFTKADKQFLKETFASKGDIRNLTSAFNIALGGLKDYIDEKFQEAFRLLPNKQEFFSRMDQLSGEYKKIDEAETLHDGKLSEHSDQLEKHEDRIKVLESRHGSKPVTPLTG